MYRSIWRFPYQRRNTAWAGIQRGYKRKAWLKRTANRGGAPQASDDKRRHRNCFQTRPLQAFPKKTNLIMSLEVRGQLMLFNLAYISTTSIYMLSVTHFDPKWTISEVRVHAGPKFGHTECWSIAKCSQSPRRNYTGGFRSWPPATCRFSTRRHLITIVKQTV